MKFVAFQDVMIQLNISLHVGDTVVYLKLKQNNMYLMAVNVCDISSGLYLSRIKLRTVCTCTVSGQKYSDKMIFYYIFHIKPQILKTLFQSQFLFDFD